MKSDKRLIVALDFPTMEEAVKVVLELGDSVSYYKVGMELYYAAGASMITFLKNQGKHVFLDLKLQDIPNTVAKSLSVLTVLGADMMNVHAVGGGEMMKAAVTAVKDTAAKLGKKAPKIIAVTVLTSMNNVQWSELNYAKPIAEQVVDLAKLAKKSGMDGVVASPQEALAIRKACGEEFLIVTPGVRPAGTALNDQSRIATPMWAMKNGSTHIVVGRPITQAEDKIMAAQNIIAEIRGVGNE
ncbi:MAG: orotidine-5'-phosphate decarboxylase [Acidaminococcaceae bacterium]|nr:orotidine-5'-phosphate decarboxylase [Acidaminococcaceae bacterium]MDD4721164.1 orotidine-5'-phosphate decarboxylase [Acidaminococcaceae bacterium]